MITTRYWPWSLTSALVAAVVAYRIDQKEQPGIRWPDTALISLVCASWAIPVVFLLHDGCSCVEPPYWRVIIVSAVTGGAIGYLIPTLYRSPITSSTWYEHFKIVVSTQTEPDGEVLAAIKVFPPGLPRPEQLPSATGSSTDDAMAEGVRSARAWINARRRQDEPPSSNLTLVEPMKARNDSNNGAFDRRTSSIPLHFADRDRILRSPSQSEHVSDASKAPASPVSGDQTDPPLV